MARVNVGKRIFNEPNGVFRTISVFSEIEPAPEVNQIREFRPNLAEILAQAEAEQEVCGVPVEMLVDLIPEPPPVTEPPAPVKPKRKPRPYKPRPKRTKP